jgi:hypothetical protein
MMGNVKYKSNVKKKVSGIVQGRSSRESLFQWSSRSRRAVEELSVVTTAEDRVGHDGDARADIGRLG